MTSKHSNAFQYPKLCRAAIRHPMLDPKKGLQGCLVLANTKASSFCMPWILLQNTDEKCDCLNVYCSYGNQSLCLVNKIQPMYKLGHPEFFLRLFHATTSRRMKVPNKYGSRFWNLVHWLFNNCCFQWINLANMFFASPQKIAILVMYINMRLKVSSQHVFCSISKVYLLAASAGWCCEAGPSTTQAYYGMSRALRSTKWAWGWYYAPGYVSYQAEVQRLSGTHLQCRGSVAVLLSGMYT